MLLLLWGRHLARIFFRSWGFSLAGRIGADSIKARHAALANDFLPELEQAGLCPRVVTSHVLF